jgi:hypothetical protein
VHSLKGLGLLTPSNPDLVWHSDDLEFSSLAAKLIALLKAPER